MPQNAIAKVRQFDPATLLRVNRTRAANAPTTASPLVVNIHEALRKARLTSFPPIQGAEPQSEAAPDQDKSPTSEAIAPMLEPAPAEAPVGRARLGNALSRLRALAAAQDEGESTGGAFERDDDDEGRPGRVARRASAADVTMQEVTGTLSSVKLFNDWAIGSVWTPERESQRVTGQALVGLTEGLEYVFRGALRTHPTHGESLEVSVATPTISNDEDAIGRYLVKSFSGIGKARATKYLKQLREQGGDQAIEQLRQTLLNAPWDLDLTAIAGNAKFAEGEDPQAQARMMAVARNIMLRAGGAQGVREGVAKDLAVWLLEQLSAQQEARQAAEQGTEQEGAAVGLGIVEQTWAILARNPYGPIRKVSGYGFATAEAVAKVVGTPRDAQCRLGALVEYAAEIACERRGHSYLTAADFKDAMLKVDPQAPARQALIEAIRLETVVVEGDRIYLPHLLEAEKRLAKGLAKLMEPSASLTQRPAQDVRNRLTHQPGKIHEMFANGFDVAQIDALVNIMKSPQRLHVLTGGPGTGKTTIVQALVSLLKTRSFAFAAPTGKAAKVLSGRVRNFGYDASTVHSLLVGSEDSGFKHNSQNPLELDVLVVDESTMNGVQMADAIVNALPDGAHLIVLGDPGITPKTRDSSRPPCAGQLPSISPGRFMYDLQEIPGVNHEHLEKTFRNSGGILEVVKEVAAGKLDVRNRESVYFSGSLPDPVVGFGSVMSQYLAAVRKDGFENTMLVMPKRQGERDTPGWNTTYANAVLREVCNPGADRLPGTLLHLGDRIIVQKNMEIEQPEYDDLEPRRVRTAPPEHKPQATDDLKQMFESLVKPVTTPESSTDVDSDDEIKVGGSPEPKGRERVINGDTGRIGAYVMPATARLGAAEWVRLDLDDGRKVWLPGRDVGVLSHSYAVTVHAAQGSEYANVIMVVTPGGADFMNQTMLLTGVSRAKENLAVWGDPAVLRRVAATPMPSRNSGLVARVEQEIQNLTDADQDQTTEADLG